MHVVIDLGETHSYLSCWERDKSLREASIQVKLAGAATYRSVPATPLWGKENMREYLAFINREYLIPSRMIIESAALATPCIFNLNQRRILLDVLEEIFGLYEAVIIPHPIALIAGIQLNASPLPLVGDILVIEERDLSYKFAFISSIETIGITLEKQFSGSFSELLAEAESLGYLSAQGWHTSHILLLGNYDQGTDMADFIATLPDEVNIIYGQDLEFAAAEGLSAVYNRHNMHPAGSFNVIYPYEFYLEKNEPAALERIPFDTSNLELNCSGRYSLLNLNHAGIYSLADDENRVRFRIYELKTDTKPNHFPLLPPAVLDIDSRADDLPPYFELRLDMANANIQLDLISESLDEVPDTPEVLEKRLKATRQRIHQLLSRDKQNEALLKAWNESLLTPEDQDPSMSEQIDQTIFHLYGLLQLWNNR